MKLDQELLTEFQQYLAKEYDHRINQGEMQDIVLTFAELYHNQYYSELKAWWEEQHGDIPISDEQLKDLYEAVVDSLADYCRTGDTQDREYFNERVWRHLIGWRWPMFGDNQSYKDQFYGKLADFKQRQIKSLSGTAITLP